MCNYLPRSERWPHRAANAGTCGSGDGSQMLTALCKYNICHVAPSEPAFLSLMLELSFEAFFQA